MIYIDYAVIALYFAVTIGMGFWYRKRASQSLDAYFLGGNRMHWLALAMSGSVSNFDITGTMWIVSLLFMLGMKSMWIHWMWGWMMGAFCLAYMGKWVRRSNVMTGAEWMRTRFGDGPAGRTARTAYALMAVLTLASFIGYAFQGIGKFAAVYIPLSPTACALLIIGLTTFYVILGGLYSVVVTDVLQTIILTLAAILISAVAFVKLSAAAPPEGWTSLLPAWRIENLEGAAVEYQLFGALAIVWVLKGILLNAGGPAQMYDFQRFLAARDARDAAKIGAAWSIFLVVRWAMTAGIALLALTGIGSVSDPEQVMPLVLHEYLPTGVRGFVIAGLLAAFMSTFSSTVNSGASYIVRDLWQPFLRRDVSERGLMAVSYAATFGIVAVGILIGFQADSIAMIWNWMMMALGAGVIMPNVLRWYWWRMNGWGYAAGTAAGIAASIVALFRPDAPVYIQFPVIAGASLLASLGVTWVTPPVASETLREFYESVRPFGLWGPVRGRAAMPAPSRGAGESAWRAAANTLIGIVAIHGLYLSPMYFVAHAYGHCAVWGAAALAAISALRFTWWPYLPFRNESEGTHETDAPQPVEKSAASV